MRGIESFHRFLSKYLSFRNYCNRSMQRRKIDKNIDEKRNLFSYRLNKCRNSRIKKSMEGGRKKEGNYTPLFEVISSTFDVIKLVFSDRFAISTSCPSPFARNFHQGPPDQSTVSPFEFKVTAPSDSNSNPRPI